MTQIINATGAIYSVKDQQLIVDSGKGEVSIDEKDFTEFEKRAFYFLNREAEKNLDGKKKYQVINTQEILVDFFGYVIAASNEEAIAKLKENDIEFTGKYTLSDSHYLGDYERLCIYDVNGDTIYDSETDKKKNDEQSITKTGS